MIIIYIQRLMKKDDNDYNGSGLYTNRKKNDKVIVENNNNNNNKFVIHI